MYGYLVLKDDKSIDTIFTNWMQLLRNSPSSAQEKEALKVLDVLCSPKDPFRKQVNNDEFTQLFSRIPSNVLSFGISLWLAHLRLPVLTRKLRLAAIDGIVSAQFDGLEPLNNLELVRQNFGRMALLLPDPLQDCDIRDECANFLNSELPNTNFFKLKLQPLLNSALSLVQKMPAARFDLLKNHVWMTICTRRHEEREATAKSMLQLFQAQKFQLLEEADQSAKALSPPLPQPLFYDAVCQMVVIALTSNDLSNAEIINGCLNQASDLYASLINRATRDTMEAVAAGTSLGDKTVGSQQALREFNGLIDLQSRKQTRDCAQLARQRRKGTSTPLPEAQQVEAAALQAWSMEQLARWIEGPLPEKRPGGRIDRKAILERQQRPSQSAKSKQPAPKSSAQDTDSLTADDLDETIQQAFAATASFFLSEINSLMIPAKTLNAPHDLMAPCLGMVDTLQQLASSQEPLQEENAAELLTRAEHSIRELRQGLKSAESAAKLQARFPNALIAALRLEPLELGKRQGGQIGYTAGVEDWAYVSGNFHNRWLPQVKGILVNGKRTQLRADQAVALYVTGSSQSGYAFDVSVHLWQRRQARQSQPGVKGGLFPPMNQEDWFDTYVTCCVLHVPAAG
ncbi:hypothetical protein [Hydrogenophaga sp.]|uniref:hypothetical protein n=1 Tax=Hydrogenophaga sp. TaxID=1904254 RepID=UPI003D11F486